MKVLIPWMPCLYVGSLENRIGEIAFQCCAVKKPTKRWFSGWTKTLELAYFWEGERLIFALDL
jgi:hypothetical protein